MSSSPNQRDSLPVAVWRERADRHSAAVTELTAAHLARRSRREAHPVEDFLWTYYSVRPSELRRWHPGTAVLAGAGAERGAWKFYTTQHGSAQVDLPTFFAKRGPTVDYVAQLLSSTLERTPRYGCFGLHEWAMVYRMTPEQIRHRGLSLRIGHELTDQVVESHQIGCTHFDAFRFFTADAVPLNAQQLTRETQPELEQAGCLHAGMDVYKWAAKLGPIVPGEVLLDAYVLARDIREVDMRASPYDVSAYAGANGDALTAIPIETAAGKREYAALQRGFATRGNLLRSEVLTAIAAAREHLSFEREQLEHAA